MVILSFCAYSQAIQGEGQVITGWEDIDLDSEGSLMGSVQVKVLVNTRDAESFSQQS